MTANRVCWDRSAIAYATQVDVGGLEIGDARADAVFSAIHHPLPLHRVRDVGTDDVSTVTEEDVLRTFTKSVNANEPVLVFVTGQKGTGKSHLVRWLKSKIGLRDEWHIVYIAKRNTSLRRVTELILAGIDTPGAAQLREALDKASSEIASDEEAMDALLNKLDQLVTYDQAVDVQALPGLPTDELADLRRKAHRLLGDFTFRAELSKPNGPVHRIARLANGGYDESDESDEDDLRLTEADLMVDPAKFDDAMPDLRKLVSLVCNNRQFRTEIATLCDSYLGRAKTEVFVGPRADLLAVFEDVRKVIASQNKELCLFVEDLVLLHGIDKQLAQALTIPATAELCKLRAAIAVTDGYLKSIDTFTDRGERFRLDMDMRDISKTDLRSFVGRYLNVGRLPEEKFADEENACLSCDIRKHCHATFDTTELGHGLYPFNGAALDRLIALASKDRFRPREVLREVIRAPLETAEEELPQSGTFPSADFARALDKHREDVPPAIRVQLDRLNPGSQESEISLRAFYALKPPIADPDLRKIADYFGASISDTSFDTGEVPADDEGVRPQERDVDSKKDETAGMAVRDEFDRWATGNTSLNAGTAHSIRMWICEAVVSQLESGRHGLSATATSSGASKKWQIGAHTLYTTDIEIAKSGGAGSRAAERPFPIEISYENALLLRGVFKASKGGTLDEVDSGLWYFPLQAEIDAYSDKLAQLAHGKPDIGAAVQTLMVIRNAAEDPGATVREAMPAMLRPTPPGGAHIAVRDFVDSVNSIRREALETLRDYVTTAKGDGKPSLIDVVAIYSDMRSSLKTTSVATGSVDVDSGSGLLMRLATKLRTSSQKAWPDVAVEIKEIGRFLDLSENLDTLQQVVGKLVVEAHNSRRMPRADSKQEYEVAVAGLVPKTMEIYRHFSKVVAAEPAPGDLWKLRDDPLPALRALRHYAETTNRLLEHLESSVAPADDDDSTVDTDGLVKDFRALADELDKIANGGVR
jgi:hypothetical protein